MVNKKTLVLLGGLGILAYAFLSRPKVISTTFEPVPYPVAIPQPIDVPIPFPYLDPTIAQNLLESKFGTLYRQITQTVNNPALNEYIRKAGGFRSGAYQKDFETAVNTYGIPPTISTTKFGPI